MLLEVTLEWAFNMVDNARLVIDHMVIPAHCPHQPNSPYRPGYDWLFRYERELARALAPWVARHRHELFGVEGIISEALSNAFVHGHGRNPSAPIGIIFHWCTNALQK